MKEEHLMKGNCNSSNSP